MNRRHLLATTATAIAVGVAGCGGSDDDDSGGNTTNDTNDTSDTPSGNGNGNPNGAGEEALDEAVTALTDTAAVLEETAGIQTTVTEANLTTLRDNTDAASTALDEAEQAASGDLDGQLPAARDVLKFQNELVTSRENSVALSFGRQSNEALSQFNSAVANAESLGSVDPAFIDEIRQDLDVESLADEQISLYETLEDRQSSLNVSPLDEPALEYDGDLSQYVRYEPNQVEVNRSLLLAFREYFEAIRSFLNGASDFEAERWSAAEDNFTQAADIVASSVEMINSIETGDSQNIRVPPSAIAANLSEIGDRLEQGADIAASASAGNVESAREEYNNLVEGVTPSG